MSSGSGGVPKFGSIPTGIIDAASTQFDELRAGAQVRLAEILQYPSNSLGAKLRRQVALSKLNALLSFHGWAIKRDGTMFEVRVRNLPVDLNLPEHNNLRYGSLEDVNEWARRYYAATGVLKDPRDGKQLPESERHRFGIS